MNEFRYEWRRPVSDNLDLGDRDKFFHKSCNITTNHPVRVSNERLGLAGCVCVLNQFDSGCQSLWNWCNPGAIEDQLWHMSKVEKRRRSVRSQHWLWSFFRTLALPGRAKTGLPSWPARAATFDASVVSVHTFRPCESCVFGLTRASMWQTCTMVDISVKWRNPEENYLPLRTTTFKTERKELCQSLGFEFDFFRNDICKTVSTFRYQTNLKSRPTPFFDKPKIKIKI